MGLCNTYEAVDRCSEEPSERVAAIKVAVQQSYEICTSGGKCSIQTTIAAHGLDAVQTCKERVIRQVNKIGRYWGLCMDMAEDSRRYSVLFKNISLDFLAPYNKTSSRVHGKAITRANVRCRVHAEIQLLVFLDQRAQSEFLRPRVIGVNKAACYLCNLFFLAHGSYFITKTHGRLYEQWTLPDLKQFSEQQRREYRRIIATMTKILKTAANSQPTQRRVDPMQSYVCLPTPPDRSPLPSYAATIISDAALSAFRPPNHDPPTPRASLVELANAPQVKSSPIPTVRLSPIRTSPAPSDDLVKHSQSRSRTPSPLGSSSSTPSARSDFSPKSLRTLPVQPNSPAKHLRSRSRTPSPLKLSISSLSSLPAHSDTSPKPLHTKPLQPSSQLPSPTKSASETDSNQELAPTHVDDASQVPHSTGVPYDSNPFSSSSTISLHPLQLPLTQPITAIRPLRLSAPGLRITVEIDGSSSGEARILNPDPGNENSATVIETDSLKPGETITLLKDEDAPCLSLLMCRRRRAELGCHLELSWPS